MPASQITVWELTCDTCGEAFTGNSGQDAMAVAKVNGLVFQRGVVTCYSCRARAEEDCAFAREQAEEVGLDLFGVLKVRMKRAGYKWFEINGREFRYDGETNESLFVDDVSRVLDSLRVKTNGGGFGLRFLAREVDFPEGHYDLGDVPAKRINNSESVRRAMWPGAKEASDAEY